MKNWLKNLTKKEKVLILSLVLVLILIINPDVHILEFKMAMVKKFKTNLKDILKNMGIKQNWLANKLNRTESEVSRWVNGAREPNDDIKEQIAEVLRLPQSAIFFIKKTNDKQKE